MNELRPVQLPRPNEACWCGSGEKYKKCHRGADSVSVRAERSGTDARRIKPGLISPKREVPASIPRPDYARTGRGMLSGTGRRGLTSPGLMRRASVPERSERTETLSAPRWHFLYFSPLPHQHASLGRGS